MLRKGSAYAEPSVHNQGVSGLLKVDDRHQGGEINAHARLEIGLRDAVPRHGLAAQSNLDAGGDEGADQGAVGVGVALAARGPGGVGENCRGGGAVQDDHDLTVVGVPPPAASIFTSRATRSNPFSGLSSAPPWDTSKMTR